MYKKNDTVVYGREGVCRIDDIAEFDFSGKDTQYYVLRPIYSKGKENQVTYVPTENSKLLEKMRPVLSADSIKQLVTQIPEDGMQWIPEEGPRKRQYVKIMDEGIAENYAAVIKSIYLQKKRLEDQGKKLHLCDEKMMQDAEKILYDEFACVLSIEPEEVIPFIMNELAAENKNI